MHQVAAVKEKIDQGQILLLAGDERLLGQLPAGNWIGGSIPYFMTDQGGLSTPDRLYVTELPGCVSNVSITVYNKDTIANVYTDAAKNGFSIIIIPASSPTHLEFALHAPNYQDFAIRPLVGWISGVHLDDLGKISPKVFSGPTHAI
ncbi:MAG: hypothetical protein AB1649_31850, partial [Chloroflexota bacterium]